MRLRFTAKAESDFAAISDYIRDRNPGAAVHVGEAIDASLKLITTYPQSGRAYRGGVRRFTVPRYPYLVFYAIDEVGETIIVLTIRHAARRPA